MNLLQFVLGHSIEVYIPVKQDRWESLVEAPILRLRVMSFQTQRRAENNKIMVHSM